MSSPLRNWGQREKRSVLRARSLAGAHGSDVDPPGTALPCVAGAAGSGPQARKLLPGLPVTSVPQSRWSLCSTAEGLAGVQAGLSWRPFDFCIQVPSEEARAAPPVCTQGRRLRGQLIVLMAGRKGLNGDAEGFVSPGSERAPSFPHRIPWVRASHMVCLCPARPASHVKILTPSDGIRRWESWGAPGVLGSPSCVRPGSHQARSLLFSNSRRKGSRVGSGDSGPVALSPGAWGSLSQLRALSRASPQCP